MWLWRNPDNVTHRQLLSIDQVWWRSTSLTWSRWGCRRLADNIWLLAHANNNNWCWHQGRSTLSEASDETWSRSLLHAVIFVIILCPLVCAKQRHTSSEPVCPLMQVSKSDAVAELTRPVAGVLLVLMSNLSQTFRASDAAEGLLQLAGTEQLSQYIALLDDERPLPTAKSSTTLCGGSRSSYSASFQVVLRGLLQHIIGCSEYGINENSARTDPYTFRWLVVRQNQKFSPRHRPPSRGARRPKFNQL